MDPSAAAENWCGFSGHGKTVGEIVSALARQGLNRGHRAARAERNGVPLLPSRRDAAPVTLELVNQLRDELP